MDIYTKAILQNKVVFTDLITLQSEHPLSESETGNNKILTSKNIKEYCRILGVNKLEYGPQVILTCIALNNMKFFSSKRIEVSKENEELLWRLIKVHTSKHKRISAIVGSKIYTTVPITQDHVYTAIQLLTGEHPVCTELKKIIPAQALRKPIAIANIKKLIEKIDFPVTAVVDFLNIFGEPYISQTGFLEEGFLADSIGESVICYYGEKYLSYRMMHRDVFLELYKSGKLLQPLSMQDILEYRIIMEEK